MLTVLNEYSRERRAIAVARRLRSDDVLQVLAALFVLHGAPYHIRPDNGSEFTAKAVQGWLQRLGVKTLDIAPSGAWPQWSRVSREEGSPGENGYNEPFNGKLRDEMLDGETF